jgi:DNA-binding transcriptional LysR family regulator
MALVIGDSKEIVKKTMSGQIEMGFIGARFAEPHMHETALTDDRLKLIVHPQHAWAGRSSIEIDALRTEPMIVREAGSGTLQVLKTALRVKGLDLGEHFHIIAEIGNTVGIIGAIKSGLGVSIISSRAVEDDLINGRLIALDIQNLDLQRHIYLVVDQRRTLSPLARAFHHFIAQQIQKGEGAFRNDFDMV